MSTTNENKEQQVIGPLEGQVRDRLDKMMAKGLENIHMSFAPGAEKLSREEISKHVLEVFDEMDRWQNMTPEEKMKEQIKDAYFPLKKAASCCKFNLKGRDWTQPFTRDQQKLMAAHSFLEGALLLLGNHISKDDMREIYAKHKEWYEDPSTQELIG